MTSAAAMIEVNDISVSFGEVVALDGVSLQIMPGECIGLVGHNGAGKSTIVNVINGGLTPQAGVISSDGEVQSPYGINAARARGLRCVFQELSLCPNLSIIENTRIMHRTLGGWGWRDRARAIISESLDDIFPDHGIDPSSQIGALSIAERQMVEVAMAFSDPGIAPRLVILDEPTSSLDAGLAAQLLAKVRRFVKAGGAVVLISHILQEILSTSTRIVVMKDAKIVVARPAEEFTQNGLVEAMGSATREHQGRTLAKAGDVVLTMPPGKASGIGFTAHKGEVIGLAGLGGHGQTRMLLALFEMKSPNWLPKRDKAVTFVAGDRRLNGVFDLWSILRNITIASIQDLARWSFVRRDMEAARGNDWKTRIGIRTPSVANPILSLSGGNQQKVLFARALGTRAPVVLMDDPMRGVDVGTKQEVYEIIRSEAAAGRTFVWYSTEMEEMQFCDRVYVFREGSIVAELSGDDITENAILRASFREEAA
jgi:ribose transport system ATP-binding protein